MLLKWTIVLPPRTRFFSLRQTLFGHSWNWRPEAAESTDHCGASISKGGLKIKICNSPGPQGSCLPPADLHGWCDQPGMRKMSESEAGDLLLRNF